MKRFVTYLYQYENGQKIKNTGFAKVEVKEENGRIELTVKGVKSRGNSMILYGFLENESCVKMQEFPLQNGSAVISVEFDEKNVMGCGYGFSSIRGLILKGEDCLVASSWVDDTSGKLTSGEIDDILESKKKEELTEIREEKVEEVEKKVEKEEKEGDVSYRRIDLADIRMMPKKNWYLCNNNFLIHGFFNYHYLLEKCVKSQGKETYYIGVPGIYEKRERMMASLFGFDEFEPSEQEAFIEGQEMDNEAGQNTFGYYLCPLARSE